ncbi:MAG: hypothetical protein ACE5GW_14015, partial [Planctomycetota bacterium]
MRPSGIVITVVSLGLVGGVVFWELRSGRASPGPLSPVHAREAALAGPDDCAGCHGEESASMAAACGVCHEEIEAELASGRGLHGQLAGELGEGCGYCHVEHQGDAFPIVADTSFERAGVPDRARYDHRGLGFHLAGRHQDLACARCHEAAEAPLLEPGQKRFLGLSQACGGCHRDAHSGAFGSGCEACHGQERPFTEVSSFRHDPGFLLEGGHGGVACLRCHEEGGEHSVGALARGAEERGGGPPSRRRPCASCHENPHRPGAPGSPGARLSIADSSDCSRCHTTDRFAGARFGPAEHARIGVALDGPHRDAECAGCHRPGRIDGRGTAAGRGRGLERCALCHEDPHARVAGGPSPRSLGFRERRSCRECHDGDRFL